MTELFLKFIDEIGEEREVLVEQEEFIVGRHSENDLSIVNPKLSRQHIKIQRFGDVFVVTDLDSSNGTTINGEELDEPVALKDGDVLNLGGGLDMEIEVDDPNAVDNSSDENEEDEKESEKSASASAGSSGSVSSVSSQSSGGGSGVSKALILAPILGLLILFTAVGTMFIISGSGNKEIVENDPREDGGFITTSSPDEEDEDTPKPTNDNESVVKTPISNDTPQTNGTNNTDVNKPLNAENTPETLPTGNGTNDAPPAPDESDNIGTIRNNSFKFMRKIARSNQKPVLLSNQLKMLENKVQSFKGSRALANNIKNAQRNSSAIQSLARSKNLKPQFLVTAALAKLGNSDGNVLAKAQEMVDVLKKLNTVISDEKADDNLIIIAAYDQGVRGDTLKMRNTLQRFAKSSSRASEIRTIWFLKEKNAISNAQFEFALRFLAIGTITQNPKAFNVNANALVLN